MIKKLIAISILAFVSIEALGQGHIAREINGNWSGKGPWDIDITFIVLDVLDGVVAADLVIGNQDCSGGLTGLGQLRDNVLTLTPYLKEEDNQKCTVRVAFERSGKLGFISESQCGEYHGKACEFSGKIYRTRR